MRSSSAAVMGNGNTGNASGAAIGTIFRKKSAPGLRSMFQRQGPDSMISPRTLCTANEAADVIQTCGTFKQGKPPEKGGFPTVDKLYLIVFAIALPWQKHPEAAAKHRPRADQRGGSRGDGARAIQMEARQRLPFERVPPLSTPSKPPFPGRLSLFCFSGGKHRA